MIRIVITSPEIREMKGVGKTSGKPYHMRFQNAHAFTVDKDGIEAEFPDKFEMMLENDQLPYPRGKYVFHSSAFRISRDGKPEFLARLVPAPAASAKA